MNKVDFVEELLNFYQNVVGNVDGIEDMHYEEINGDEFIYVTFGKDSQKRIHVTGDNNRGMLMDFCRFLDRYNEYRWLTKEEQR